MWPPPPGIITSTFIQYMDEDLVLLGRAGLRARDTEGGSPALAAGAIWDGQDDLDLGAVRLRRLPRPVQGMLGFFGVFDVVAQTFLFVQEVAPEVCRGGGGRGPCLPRVSFGV